MKTKALKYYVWFQTLIIAGDILSILTACVIMKGYLLIIPVLHMAGGVAQIAGSGVYLLKHKSPGQINWIKIHFFGSIAYLIFMYLLSLYHAIQLVVFVTWFVVPVGAFFGYYYLCVKELRFLQSSGARVLR